MNRNQYLYNDWRADDEEEEEKEEQPKSDLMMFSKNWKNIFLKPECLSVGSGG